MTHTALARIVDAWHRAGSRERIVIGSIAVVVLAAAAVLWIVLPLQDAVGRAGEDLARERMLLATARHLVAEDAGLARAIAPARAGDAASAIDRVLAQNGLSPLSAAHAGTDGRIDVVVPEASFDALVRALDALSREDGIRVVEATLLARVAPGSVRAELAFVREPAGR